MSFQSIQIGHSDIMAVSGSLQHVDLMCHMPRFYWKLTEKIEFFCFHNFLLIFPKFLFIVVSAVLS